MVATIKNMSTETRQAIEEMNTPHGAAAINCGLTISFLETRLSDSESYDREAEARHQDRSKLPWHQRPLDAGHWLRKRQEIHYISSHATRVKLKMNLLAWKEEEQQIMLKPKAERVALFHDLLARIEAKKLELQL